ncbi:MULTISPECIES: hypothetical protein [unclassified Streptomyces]|uniref:hypothetical protein n=1 Tax=unclassified Streptomyces TaxID=2593676 RepID=UPI0033BBE5D8
MFGPRDETPQHEWDSAASHFGPQLDQSREDWEYGVREQMQLRQDMETAQWFGLGPFAGTATPEADDYVAGTVYADVSQVPHIDPNNLTPLQKRQQELTEEALERDRQTMKENHARRAKERQALWQLEQDAKRQREAREQAEANRPTAPLPTPSPLATGARMILWVLGVVVALTLLSAIF